MMKVFICPKCGWVRTVSRRKEVECFKCPNPTMVQAKISFVEYSAMNEQQRKDYAESWMFIHSGGNHVSRRKT